MSSGGQATKLNELDTTSVDLVTRGANKRRFALKKGDAVTAQDALIQILKDAMPGDQDWASIDKMCADAGLDAQGAETYKALVKLSTAYKDSPAMATMVRDNLTKLFGQGSGGTDPAPAPGQENLAPQGDDKKSPPFGQDKPQEQSGTPPAKQSPLEEDGKEKPMSTQKADPAGTQTADTGKAGAEELQKSIDAQVKSAVAAAVQEAVAKSAEASNTVIKGLETKLQEQADKALKAEWVVKAKEDLQGVPGKSIDELGAMLFDLEKAAGRKVAEGQFEVMKGASQAVLKSAAFAPSGSVRSTNVDSAEGKIAVAATAVVKAAEGGITSAQAIRKALESDPSLYATYLNEHPGQTGGVKFAR